MCRYSADTYKVHYVCLPCRVTTKRRPEQRPQLCNRCQEHMIDAGRDFAAPRRRDSPAWRALGAVLYAGLDFHSCGCKGPGFRPRTPRQVRERLQVAGRRGIPARDAIALYDPYEA
ncbi:deoxyxylulose-5-phosphate synthase [Nonomuraea sp. C10]|nr:deoxyxylulose-5-phosphate synthase [Nonomuraea sp. C10]